MLSYNKIIQLNRQFANLHWQIKTFGNGEAYNIVLHDKEDWFTYPLMWMEDLPFPLNDKEFQYYFRVYFIGQVAQLKDQETDLDSTNENEVKSDMIQCAQDLLAFWEQDSDYSDVVLVRQGIVFNTITDKFSDRVTGCYIDLKLKQAFTYNKCAIPMTGVTPTPSSDCAPVHVLVNGISFGDVQSGEPLDLEVLFGSSRVGSKVGDDLIIDVEYENGTNIGTAVGGKIIVPNPIVIPTTRIYTKAMDSGSLVSYADGDPYYRKINEIGKLVQPEVGVVMRLQFGSFALLEYPNIHGNLYRITGITGGYRNPIDGLYYTKLNVLSTYAEAFPFDIGIDHLSSDLIDMRATANNIWTGHCASGLVRTTAGFTGWYPLSVPEGVRYGSWGTSLSYNNGNPPFDWGTNLKVLGDTYAGGTTQCMVLQTFGHITSTSKANNNKCVFIKPININTDIPIT